jgi:NAD(P)-dependent dehydrogenase (short-subunit alcohol dehydrogenase family)
LVVLVVLVFKRSKPKAEDAVQVAIITGAGSGIGLASARAISAMGIRIFGVGRDPAKLVELEAAIGDRDNVGSLSVDLMDADAPKRVVDGVLARFGRVDFLVNNAGVGKPKPLLETDDEMLDYFLDLMLKAPFRLTREVLPHLPPGSGIVNVTSTFAMVGGLRGGAYSAAKGGMTALTLHLAAQYGPAGVRANAVAPGVVPTPMTYDRLQDEKFVRMNVEMTPYTRLGTADDIAGAVAFLCSPAAEFINGQTIVVDGGWSTTKYLSPRALNSVWTLPEEGAP